MLKLVFDSLRAPYDLANILQVAVAAGNCEVLLCGNSIHHDHPKVWGKVQSWCEPGMKDLGVVISYYPSLADCVHELKLGGYLVVGTSPKADAEYTDVDFSGKVAVVFGNESTGLSASKSSLMDRLVKVPMRSSPLRFMTLSVVVPVIVYYAKARLLP